MNVLDYLENFKDIPFSTVPFNELDALACSIVSYFPFHYITKKKKISGAELYNLLSQYVSPNPLPRKVNDLKLLRLLCSTNRYNGIKICHFKRVFDNEEIQKQFQAVTIIIGNILFVSYSGTDGTLTGWKEDFDMAFLDVVPSEVEAIGYINEIRKKHPYKKLYVGGHSKGGRLAITAAKHLENKRNLIHIYSFDGPNYLSSFYDDEYKKIKSHIYKFTPDESIIGRLINDNTSDKIIVKSNATMLSQHDTYTWEVETNHFVTVKNYNPKATKIVTVINESLSELSDANKRIMVETIYNFMSDLNLTEFKDKAYNVDMVKKALPYMGKEWKAIPKENRSVMSKSFLKIIGVIIKNVRT